MDVEDEREGVGEEERKVGVKIDVEDEREGVGEEKREVGV